MFYTFDQNNSGGEWVIDPKRGIGHFVIVEAKSEDEATAKAEAIGLYFDGFGDCPCCGTRWSGCQIGTDEPSINGAPVLIEGDVAKRISAWCWFAEGEGYIHYMDGRVMPVIGETPNGTEENDSEDDAETTG